MLFSKASFSGLLTHRTIFTRSVTHQGATQANSTSLEGSFTIWSTVLPTTFVTPSASVGFSGAGCDLNSCCSQGQHVHTHACA